MKVAINVYPLTSGHKTRGIGYYTDHLIEELKQDESIKVEKFTKLSEIKNIDVVHYPWFDFFFHTLHLKRPAPTVVTIHDVIPLIFPNNYPVGIKGKINFLIQKIALKNCKFFITDSKTSKADIIKYLKITPEKIMVIPLAADSKFRQLFDTELLRVKRKYKLPDQFLMYVGDANWVKNLPFLIEGFKELVRLSEGNIKLVLIGGVFLKRVENITHPELESLKRTNQLIEKFNLQSHVIRPGNLADEELVAFYNLATVYIQPSLYEGFGLPLLQALSCGTPCVSSNAGSLSEVGGDAPIYFDPTSLAQFESEVWEILKNKSLQNKLSRLGLKQAEKFSWSKVAKETKLVYVKAVENE